MNGEQYNISGAMHGARSPLRFFSLVTLLSVPLWVLGAATHDLLLPGVPISALMAFCPTAAALLLVRTEGKGASIGLLKRLFDFKRMPSAWWSIPILAFMPGVMAISYAWVRWRDGAQTLDVSIPETSALFAVFLITAAGEELGWTGYITGAMLERWSELKTGILIGSVWAAWHIIPLMQVNRSFAWIGWWCLYTIALRIIMVRLFCSAGKSVASVTLFHAMSNVSTLPFIVYYDPRVVGIAAACTAAAIIWGRRK